MKGAIVIFFLILAFACKKDWKCECKNVNATYTAGEVRATRAHAKKHCESLSGANTECYLK
jgi:hypothetical protein